MKKLFACALGAVLALGLSLPLCACGEKGGNTDANTIVVGATSAPHAEILEVVKDDLAAEGYTLDIRVYSRYEELNPALADGDLDANYFQHITYLNDYNQANGTELVPAAEVHYEPFGLWGKNVGTDEYEAAGFSKTGRTIFVPNDTTNQTRALLLLQQEGFISLPEGASPTDSLSLLDITDRKGNNIVEVTAALVPAQLLGEGDGTLAVVNGNYALEGELPENEQATALAYESAKGAAAQLYVNVIAVRKGDENSPKIKALTAAVKSQKVLDFIEEKYKGSVQALFTL